MRSSGLCLGVCLGLIRRIAGREFLAAFELLFRGIMRPSRRARRRTRQKYRRRGSRRRILGRLEFQFWYLHRSRMVLCWFLPGLCLVSRRSIKRSFGLWKVRRRRLSTRFHLGLWNISWGLFLGGFDLVLDSLS